MSRKLFNAAAILSLVFGALSCNLFSPTENARHPENYGPEAMVLEGKIRMREQDWQGAIDWFDKALAKDSSLSEAYFYKGKCILRISQVDLQEVWNDVNPERADTNAVPFLFKFPPGTVGRSLNEAIPAFTFTYLPLPRDSAFRLIDSVFLERKRVYDAVCQSIALLEIIHYRPEDMDGVIKRAQYESDYLIEITVRTILSMIDLNGNYMLDISGTDSSEVNAFRILVQDIPSLDPDSMMLDSLKNISKDPKDINQKLDSILLGLNKADTSYQKFASELAEGAEESNNIDPTMADPLGDVIGDFRKLIPFYYYNDKADNDEDFYDTEPDGDTSRMIWIDWDKDELIDITRHDISVFCDTCHIGDSLHIVRHPGMYEFLPQDSSETYQRFRFTGDHGHEFIAGDWGADEEILDGEDNDRDGITDEDTRVAADTLDDDGDYYNTDPNSTINDSGYDPMIWTSTTDEVVNMSGASFSNVPLDALFVRDHAWEYGEDPASARTQIFPDRQMSTVRRYAGAYTGEFTGGDYGLDEEWFDGLDNDGDELIDEDVGERLPPEALRQYIIDQQM